MDAGRIIPRLFVVTRAAIRGRQFARMHEVLNALMTIDAIELGVDGLRERVGRKDQGNNLAVDFAGGRRIQVAVEAVAVLESLGGWRDAGKEQFKRDDDEAEKACEPQLPGRQDPSASGAVRTLCRAGLLGML